MLHIPTLWYFDTSVTYSQWFRRAKLVVIPPRFVLQQYLWNIAIHPAVGCHNSWANLRCSGCVPLGEKLLWNRSIEFRCLPPPMNHHGLKRRHRPFIEVWLITASGSGHRWETSPPDSLLLSNGLNKASGVTFTQPLSKWLSELPFCHDQEHHKSKMQALTAPKIFRLPIRQPAGWNQVAPTKIQAAPFCRAP